MNEEVISFKTAKLAKEKGFDIPLYTSYINGVFHENQPEPNGYDGWDIPDKENWNKKNWVFSKKGGSCFGCKLDNIKYFEACTAPTQSLLQKWLREIHNIEIISYPCIVGKYSFKIYKLKEVIVILSLNGRKVLDKSDSNKYFKTYEEALELGLQEALKLIKN